MVDFAGTTQQAASDEEGHVALIVEPAYSLVRSVVLMVVMEPVSLYQVTHCPFSCGV